MKNYFAFKLPLMFVTTVLIIVLVSGRVAFGAERVCYADWSKAGEHIEREELISVKEIRKLADGAIKGELIKIKLCREEEKYLYQLVVFAPDGKVQKLSVDAKEPVFN